MEVNGWRLFQYPLFENQLKKLTETVKKLSISQPDIYREHPKTKLLATIDRHVTEIIPRDPTAPEFRQGDTLGPDNRHWFRAKFHQRYRLFFRFSTKDRVIVYVWVNDESGCASVSTSSPRQDRLRVPRVSKNIWIPRFGTRAPRRTFDHLNKHAQAQCEDGNTNAPPSET